MATCVICRQERKASAGKGLEGEVHANKVRHTESNPNETVRYTVCIVKDQYKVAELVEITALNSVQDRVSKGTKTNTTRD